MEGNLHNRRAFGSRVGCSSWHRATASRRENDNVASGAFRWSQGTERSLPFLSSLTVGGGRKTTSRYTGSPVARGGAETILLNHLQKLPNGGQTEGDSRRSDAGEERLAGCKTDGPSLN